MQQKCNAYVFFTGIRTLGVVFDGSTSLFETQRVLRTFERYADYSAYDVLYEGVTLTFLVVLVDTAVDCSPRAFRIFVEFIWHNIKTFAFIKYAIVCTPLETPKILFLQHYLAATDG